MDPKKNAEEFSKELKALVKKYYGSLSQKELEPFGMHLRKSLPVVSSASSDRITTTATISLPLDTDPPDTD